MAGRLCRSGRIGQQVPDQLHVAGFSAKFVDHCRITLSYRGSQSIGALHRDDHRRGRPHFAERLTHPVQRLQRRDVPWHRIHRLLPNDGFQLGKRQCQDNRHAQPRADDYRLMRYREPGRAGQQRAVMVGLAGLLHSRSPHAT